MKYRFGACELDDICQELRRSGQVVPIEPKVYQVLHYLLQNGGRVVSKEELLEQCWPDTFVSEAALSQCLSRLRKAVQPNREEPPVVKTIPRQGYRLVAEVNRLSEDARADAAEDTSEAPPPQPPASARPLLTAERRRITAISCDVAEADHLANHMDPEAFHLTLRRYQTTCAQIIDRYGGHLATSPGSSLLIYFGYPETHEDDARRAIHAGLDILAAIERLGHEPMANHRVHLSVRIGIHTGAVIIEEMESDLQHGLLTSGTTPKLATTIQTLAPRDAVVVSMTTYQRVEGYFVCQPLGVQPLPGAAEAMALYQVLRASDAQGRLDRIPLQELTPFVGREVELALLQERWARVQQGTGQAVLLSGEAGIGKSRLAQVFKTSMAETTHTAIDFRGSPYYQHTALYPAVAWLRRHLQLDREMSPDEQLHKAEALLRETQLNATDYLPLLVQLLALQLPPAYEPLLQLPSQEQRQHTLGMLLALILAYAKQHPVLLLIEDLHWIDPTTLEWIGMLIDQGPTARILTLMTCRPVFQPPWGSRTHVTLTTVTPLASHQAEQMLQRLGGDALPQELFQEVVTQTDGVPLFVEEVAKFMLTSHRSPSPTRDPGSGRAPSATAIPETLEDSLMARLDQMGPAKRTAQLAATIGREFTYRLISAITPLDEDSLRHDLQHLVEAELLYQRGVAPLTTYLFKHALIQETAYTSLLRQTRRQYHQAIAQALDTHFSEVATTQPELLAHHHTEAGQIEQAVIYWHRAGEQANERSAYAEAIAHLKKGLHLLTLHSEVTNHDQWELQLLVTLASALTATAGYTAPEVVQVYTRVHALSPSIELPEQRFPILLELARFYSQLGQPQTSRQLGEELITLAKRQDDAVLLQKAYWMLGQTLHYLARIIHKNSSFLA